MPTISLTSEFIAKGDLPLDLEGLEIIHSDDEVEKFKVLLEQPDYRDKVAADLENDNPPTIQHISYQDLFRQLTEKAPDFIKNRILALDENGIHKSRIGLALRQKHPKILKEIHERLSLQDRIDCFMSTMKAAPFRYLPDTDSPEGLAFVTAALGWVEQAENKDELLSTPLGKTGVLLRDLSF